MLISFAAISNNEIRNKIIERTNGTFIETREQDNMFEHEIKVSEHTDAYIMNLNIRFLMSQNDCTIVDPWTLKRGAYSVMYRDPEGKLIAFLYFEKYQKLLYIEFN